MSERTDKADEYSTSCDTPTGMADLARKRRRVRRGKRPRARKKAAAGKAKGRKRLARRVASYNPLLALLVFLYMLKLINERTLLRIQESLYPKKKAKMTRRRRRPR